ncbi:unnamed protein product [Schistosoma turkestanicum]|nr:unnamed protein product [Schistosoma turkestanicum]
MMLILNQIIFIHIFTVFYVDSRLTHDEEILYNEHINSRRLLLNCRIPGQPRPIYHKGELYWDEELASLAGRQAEACDLNTEYRKTEVKKEYGDTIEINTADNNEVKNAVKSWFNEHALYNFKRNQCQVRGDCLHYKKYWDPELASLAGRQAEACDLNTEYRKTEVKKEYGDTIEINTADNNNVTKGNIKRSQPYEENKAYPCPPIATTTTTIAPITTTRNLQMGPYGRLRCNCKCRP